MVYIIGYKEVKLTGMYQKCHIDITVFHTRLTQRKMSSTS